MAEDEKWANYLSTKLTEKGKDLAAFSEADQRFLVGLVDGNIRNSDEFERFISLLDLDKNEQIELLDDYLPYLVKVRSKHLPNFYEPSSKLVDKFEGELKELKHTINVFETKVTSATENAPEINHILEEFRKILNERVTRVEETSRELTAPVRIPNRGEMTVDLVPITYLERIEEYRADETISFSMFGICLGGAISVFVNLITGGTATAATWVFTVLMFVFSVVLGLHAWTLRQRGNKIKDTILKSNEEESESN